MKSIKSFAATQGLTATEMIKTKGGLAVTISAGLDVCLVDPVTGIASTLFCDRRKRRVGSGS
jgi:hypothetical protein